MLLNDLLKDIDALNITGATDIEISSLSFDSRNISNNAMFFAVTGVESDGHNYIPAAIESGASAIICERLPQSLTEGVTYILVSDSAKCIGKMAASFYGNPSEKLKLVGVTGTNGKTTTATLLYDMFRLLGYKAGLISTIKYVIDTKEVESTHTTPDAIRINAMLAEMVEYGCEYCFMEVSSHSIIQERIAGLKFVGGVFSNITHEHLDYHKTFQEYIRAKKIFFDNLPKNAFALVNIDDRNGKVMVQNTVADIKTYSMRSFADYKFRILENAPEGMLLNIDSEEVWTSFSGEFNAYNLAAVYGVARELQIEKLDALRALSLLKPVTGRFETIRSTNGVTAIIDYAHTPDALRNVIDTINDMRKDDSKLYVVVGCGGDRDKTKRPEMAKIAVDGSDMAIFTSDNPRTEDPEIILSEMISGVSGSKKWLKVSDRREAIKAANMMAKSGDFILIAGKGHETYQIIGKTKHHFDDKEEILNCFHV